MCDPAFEPTSAVVEFADGLRTFHQDYLASIRAIEISPLERFRPLARLLSVADIDYARSHGKPIMRLSRAKIAVRYCWEFTLLGKHQIEIQADLVREEMSDVAPAIGRVLVIANSVAAVWLAVALFVLHVGTASRTAGNAVEEFRGVFKMPATVLEFPGRLAA
jgi:hypothetical protein